jgi:hypothetical protein
MASRKIGEGHLEAVGRLGVHELRAAFYPGSNIAQHTEYGLYGTMTPGEVAEARRGDGYDLEEESRRSDSVLADHAQRVKERDERDDHGRDSRGPELDRE